MELAQKLVGDRERHTWLPDHPGPEAQYDPRFTDEDIAATREALKALGSNLIYLGKTLPSLSELPDAATIVAIHEDLRNVKRLEDHVAVSGIPALSLSAERVGERATELLKAVERVAALFRDLESEPWLLAIVKTWQDKGSEAYEVKPFNKCVPTIGALAKRRQAVIGHTVTVPSGAESSPAC